MGLKKGQRPDGLIQVSAVINGKRHYFYGHSRTEAQKKRDEYKAHLAYNIPTPSTLTVDAWIEQYLNTYKGNINAAYEASYEVPYRRLSIALRGRPLQSITERILQSQLNDLAGMSFSTVEKYRQAIKAVFGKAYRNKLIPDDPSLELKLPKYTKGTHRALERWEIEVILKYWNTPDQWAGLWILIMLLCGLRRGEMMALDWKNIDLDARLLTVSQVAVIRTNQVVIEKRAKTASGIRTIPICDRLYRVLFSLPNKHGFVCLSKKGKPLTESAVSRGIEKTLMVWSKLVGTDVSFRTHDFRHTYATMLYESGVDAKAAQYLLGHADLRMTLELYTHLSQRQQDLSADLLNGYLEKTL